MPFALFLLCHKHPLNSDIPTDGKNYNFETIVWGVIEVTNSIVAGAKAIKIAADSGNAGLVLSYGAIALYQFSHGITDIIGGFHGEESLGIQMQKNPFTKDLLKYLTDPPSPPIWRREAWPFND